MSMRSAREIRDMFRKETGLDPIKITDNGTFFTKEYVDWLDKKFGVLLVDPDPNQWLHVFPLNDLIEHNTSGPGPCTNSHCQSWVPFEINELHCSDLQCRIRPLCPCGPTIDFENEIVIHAAMDRRELYEKEEK